MTNPLQELYSKMKSQPFKENKGLYLEYILQLIEKKEIGKLTEEEAGYWIIAGLLTEDLSNDPEFEEVFDLACDIEIPRESSYVQPAGKWNKETADKIKQNEWIDLVRLVKIIQLDE